MVNYQDVKPFPIPEAVMMGGHMMDHGEMKHKGRDHGGMKHEDSSMPMDSKSSNHQMKMSSQQHEMIGHEAMKHEASTMPMDSKSPDHQMPMSSTKNDMNTMRKGSDPSHAMMGSMDHKPSQTTGTKYQNLKSPVKTNDPNKPVQEIKMVLSGYMGRFMWFINGLPEFEVDPILIEPGKRYRITFTNESMMHHPMHLHGHFFILRNGNGEYDPFLHTIEVAPGATVVADFDADASGQWFSLSPPLPYDGWDGTCLSLLNFYGGLSENDIS